MLATCIKAVTILAVDAVNKANAGHPGSAMGLAPLGVLLFAEVMRFNPSNPAWPNRDRFILSNGHACLLQYILLHLSGYNLQVGDVLSSAAQVASLSLDHTVIMIMIITAIMPAFKAVPRAVLSAAPARVTSCAHCQCDEYRLCITDCLFKHPSSGHAPVLQQNVRIWQWQLAGSLGAACRHVTLRAASGACQPQTAGAT